MTSSRRATRHPRREVANDQRTSKCTLAASSWTSSPCWALWTAWPKPLRSSREKPTHCTLPCGARDMFSQVTPKEHPSVWCVQEVSAHHRSWGRRPWSATDEFQQSPPTPQNSGSNATNGRRTRSETAVAPWSSDVLQNRSVRVVTLNVVTMCEGESRRTLTDFMRCCCDGQERGAHVKLPTTNVLTVCDIDVRT